MDTPAFVDYCLDNANIDKPYLPDDILRYVGMSGDKTRRFYNAICSRPNTRYLEIGTWYGSSSISALYGNSIDATLIDNWSEFGGNKETLVTSLEKFKGANKYTLIESDSWKVDHSRLGLFNVYLYDGGHTYSDHYRAISEYIQHLTDYCIVMIDDWNWEKVRKGTLDAFRDLNIEIVHTREVITNTTHFDVNNRSNTPWWNGIGIFVIKKN